MQAGQPSRTAFGAAIHRAAHQLLDSPRLFDDPLALPILGDAGEALKADLSGQMGPMRRALRALIVARSRYTEDALAAAVARGVRQYVLLGAGLDTFAYRNPHADLRVFEVDAPATQAWKRERLVSAGVNPPPSLTYAPVDFENETLAHGLARAGIDMAAPAVFAWLGVVPYLTRPAIDATLATVAAFPPGSEIVFDYGEPPDARPLLERMAFAAMAKRVADLGEPWLSFFEPPVLAADLRALGFGEIEDLSGAAVNARYFAGRADGLVMGPTAHILRARV